MDTIGKVRAEIERRWEEAHSKYKETAEQYYDGMCTALDHLETFLDTIEEEPVDLENDAVMYCFDKGINLSPKDASEFARHFAEWGAEHLKK